MAKEKTAKKKTALKQPKKSSKQNMPKRKPPEGMSQERFDRLVAEANAPYKGFRKFIYASIGGSGAIGGFVFFTKILAGRDIAASVPNFAFQIGIVALMVFLFRWEDRNQEES
ncbi:MAG: DUF3493 domain-containing protein [Phormidesmis sp.]